MSQDSKTIVQKNALKEPQKVSVLAKRRDFLRIASGRKKWVSTGMIVQVAKQPEADSPADDDLPGIRVGYTASKKVGNGSNATGPSGGCARWYARCWRPRGSRVMIMS